MTTQRIIQIILLLLCICHYGCGQFVRSKREVTVEDIPLLEQQLQGEECAFVTPFKLGDLDKDLYDHQYKPSDPQEKEACLLEKPMVQLLSPGRLGCRLHAARCAATLGSEAKELVPMLIQLLQAELQEFDYAGFRKKDVRIQVVRALGKIGSAEAVPALIPLLKEDEWIKRITVRALTALGEKAQAAFPRLEEIALQEEGSSLSVLEALVAINPQGAKKALLSALKHDSPSKRRYALRQMGELFGKDLPPEALEAIDIDDEETVFYALKMLEKAEVSSDIKLKKILKMLASTDEASVIQQSVKVLKTIPEPGREVCDALIPHFDSLNYSNVKQAYKGITYACPGDEEIISIVIKDLENEDYNIRAFALGYLSTAQGDVSQVIDAVRPYIFDLGFNISQKAESTLLSLGLSLAEIRELRSKKPEKLPVLLENQEQAADIMNDIYQKVFLIKSSRAKFEMEKQWGSETKFTSGTVLMAGIGEYHISETEKQHKLEITTATYHNRKEEWVVRSEQWPGGSWMNVNRNVIKYGSRPIQFFRPYILRLKKNEYLAPLVSYLEGSKWTTSMIYKGLENVEGLSCYRFDYTGGTSKNIFWISAETGMIIKRQTYDLNKDDPDIPYQTIIFHDIELNPSYTEKDFTFTPKKGQLIRETISAKNEYKQREYRWE